MLRHFAPIGLFATVRTIAQEAPLSMGFSRQEYWTGLLCPSPGDRPDPGIEPISQRLLLAGSLSLAPPGKPYSPDLPGGRIG